LKLTIFLTQITSEDAAGIDVNTCNLCKRERLYFAKVPLFCVCCGVRIKKIYFCTKEEFVAQGCICSVCYNTFKGENVAFNGTSIPKKNLAKRNNDEVIEEPVSFNINYFIKAKDAISSTCKNLLN
jgi:hypothetical protein